jgi:hypothetical protein
MLPFLLATSLAGCPSASPTPDAAMREDAPAPPDAHEPAPDAHVEPWEAPPECATLGSGDTSEGVVVRGNAFAFTGEGGRIEGAYVTALEHSSWCVRTAAGGAFELLGVPVGSDITLRIHHPEYVVVQTGTHTVPADGIERLTFQVPTPGIYSLLSRVVRLEADPTRCQIAATVTEIGRSLYPSKPASPSHGEAGATVSIAPAPAEADGPVYFDYIGPNLIVPDRDLTATTRDGGVLYLNVTPGDYVLSASKDGVTFRSVRVQCIAGMLVNPSPPWSIQAIAP